MQFPFAITCICNLNGYMSLSTKDITVRIGVSRGKLDFLPLLHADSMVDVVLWSGLKGQRFKPKMNLHCIVTMLHEEDRNNMFY